MTVPTSETHKPTSHDERRTLRSGVGKSRKSLSGVVELIRFASRLTRGRVFLVALVTLVVGLTEGISLIMLIPIAAAASPAQASALEALPLIGPALLRLQPSLALLLAVFVAVVALQAFLSRARMIFMLKTLHIARDDLRRDLFQTIGAADWSSIRSRPSGDINHVISDDTEQTVSAIRSLLTLFQALSTVGIYLLLAALVSWPMALLALAVGGFLFGLLYPVRRGASRHGHEMLALYKSQNKVVLGFISSLRLSKLFVAEDQQVRAYTKFLLEARARVFDYMSIATLGTLGFRVGAALFAAIFVWVAVEVFALDLARVAVLLVIFVRIAPRFNTVQDSAQNFLTAAPSYRNYRESLDYFSKAREPHEGEDTASGGPLPPRLDHELKVENVHVHFPSAPAPALDNISLRIPAGQITAIIGPSGGGKSTLADLILGLTAPDRGIVRVDHTPLTPDNWRSWRRSVASVPQDAFLLDTSLAENLRFSREDATDAELWNALETAQVADLIRALPDGLSTPARERGTRFSGGERQRIALARALLRNPQLLVLDEATSALDWENERHIVDAVSDLRGRLTCVVIAHRPSLVACADYVIALENGRVVEQGSVTEVRQRSGGVLNQMLANSGASLDAI